MQKMMPHFVKTLFFERGLNVSGTCKELYTKHFIPSDFLLLDHPENLQLIVHHLHLTKTETL